MILINKAIKSTHNYYSGVLKPISESNVNKISYEASQHDESSVRDSVTDKLQQYTQSNSVNYRNSNSRNSESVRLNSKHKRTRYAYQISNL